MSGSTADIPVPASLDSKGSETKKVEQGQTAVAGPAAQQAQKQQGGGAAERGGGAGERRGPRRHSKGGRHHIEVPENAERDIGVVVSHQEKFGFVKSTTRDARYFFHVNDTDGHTAPSAKVSFIVAKDVTTGRDVAYDVRVLPLGAPPEERPAASISGSGSGNSAHATAGSGSMRPRNPAAAVPVRVPGRRSLDGPGSGGLTWGQEKERAAAERAAAAAAAATAGSGPEAGGSAAGESAAAANGGGATPPLAPPQQYANFGGKGGQRDAGQQQPQQQRKEQRLPGNFQGSVAQAARGSRTVQLDDGTILYRDEVSGEGYEAKYGNCRLVDGCHQLEAGDLVSFEVMFNPVTGTRRAINVRFVAKSIALTPSLEVSMAAAAAATAAAAAAANAADSDRSSPTPPAPQAAMAAAQAETPKAAAAAAAAAVATAAAAAPPPLAPGRQLGRVALLKKEFGFIRQMERPGDMFFHFSQLDGITPEELKVGDDVEYCVRRDGPEGGPGKLSAVAVRRAAPGSVVFDVVTEESYRGVVLEKPLVTKQYMQTNGVLELSEGHGGAKSRLTFTAGDSVQPQSMRSGDHVSFRIATNLQAAKAAAKAGNPAAAQAGRRAVHVEVIRLQGTVVATKGQFGFIAYVDPWAGGGEAKGPQGAERKVFFHNSEVASSVTLKPGDEVSFVPHTHTKTGELNAQRVRRIKEAPEGYARPAEEALPDRNPNQGKYVGNLAGGEHKKQALRQPKGPDGGRGFGMGRGRGLAPLPGAALHPLAPGAPSPSPFAAAAELHTALHLPPPPLPLQHAVAPAPPSDAASSPVDESKLEDTKLEVLKSLASARRSLSGPLNPSAAAFVPRSASMDRFVSALSTLGSSRSGSVERFVSLDPPREEGEAAADAEGTQQRAAPAAQQPQQEGDKEGGDEDTAALAAALTQAAFNAALAAA